MKKRFTDEQIIGVLKEAAAGAKVAELLRRHGISEATFYNWKAKQRSAWSCPMRAGCASSKSRTVA